MTTRLFDRCNLVPTLLMVVMISVTGWWLHLLYYEHPWLSYKNLPFEPLIAHVKPGQVIPLKVIRCNSDDIDHTYKVARSFENTQTGVGTLIPNTVLSIRPGCHTEISQAHVVPLGLEPGQYRLIGLSDIQGISRTFSVEWNSQLFEVVVDKDAKNVTPLVVSGN